MDKRTIRLRAGWSQNKVATFAEVGPALVRIYELEPRAVTSERKRESLDRIYRGLRVCVGESASLT